jgi:hypothetical protein
MDTFFVWIIIEVILLILVPAIGVVWVYFWLKKGEKDDDSME